MATVTTTIPAANVSIALSAITTIQNLVANGNPNLLTANQNTAMLNVQTLFTANPGGFTNYTFVDSQLQDFLTFAGAINNLGNTGPTLTYTQNQIAAGNVTAIPTVDPVANAFPVGANTVVFNDSYFICENPGTGTISVSNSNDGFTWNVLAQVTAEANPDNVLAVDLLNGEIVVFGQQTIQYFSDQALIPQIYGSVQGATQQYGLAAIYSRAPFQGTIAFLGQNRQGTCQVMTLQGYQPVAISTPDIDHLINQFTYVNDAMACSYTIDGHEMYEITFPIAGYTFMYDAKTGIWSTLQSGVQDGGRHKVQFCTTFNFNNFCSDYISGKIYYLDINAYDDDGAAILRQVTTRHLYEQGNVFGIDEVFLDMDTGEGLQTGQGSDPKLMMTVSKDNGRTFGNERTASLGKVGQYRGPRVTFRRLGSSRDFVLKFRMTDPVPFTIVSASAVIRGGNEENQ